MVSECVKDLYQIKKALIVILIPLVLLPLPLIDGTQVSSHTSLFIYKKTLAIAILVVT